LVLWKVGNFNKITTVSYSFAEYFSNQFADYKIIMGMDNASWHSREKSKNIDNIVHLFQPPYSPEVNPAENIRRYIRTNGGLKNTTFGTIKEVEECLCRSVNNLLSDKKTVKSITVFKWIMDTIKVL
jgi:transposase